VHISLVAASSRAAISFVVFMDLMRYSKDVPDSFVERILQMSENLHAVGFLTDIITSLEKRIRGKAKEAIDIDAVETQLDGKSYSKHPLFPLLEKQIIEFVGKIDETLDENFGGPHND
jgi:hypothetical protein